MQHTELILQQAPRPRDSIVVAKTVQDVEPILENNAILRDMPQRSDWGRHIADIPNVIVTRWLNEEHERGNVGIQLFGKEFNELVARKLRDPEWAYLRTDSQAVQGIMGFGS